MPDNTVVSFPQLYQTPETLITESQLWKGLQRLCSLTSQLTQGSLLCEVTCLPKLGQDGYLLAFVTAHSSLDDLPHLLLKSLFELKPCPL